MNEKKDSFNIKQQRN